LRFGTREDLGGQENGSFLPSVFRYDPFEEGVEDLLASQPLAQVPPPVIGSGYLGYVDPRRDENVVSTIWADIRIDDTVLCKKLAVTVKKALKVAGRRLMGANMQD
jgi:hypothetical protein